MIGPIALIRELPEGYEEACYETGAITRKRGVKSPGELMLLVMIHLISGCSLMEISEIARLGRFGEMSDVAFMKRFKNCNEWFKWIIDHMETKGLIEYDVPEKLKEYRIVAVDASDVKEKGRSQRIFRLHFSLDLSRMQAYKYNITTNSVGEKLENFDFEPKDLVIADRAYGTIKGIEYCNQRQVKYVIRLRNNALKVYDEDDKEINVLERLQGSLGEIFGYVHTKSGEKLPVRICYCRKTPEAQQQTEKKLKRRASKKQQPVSSETFKFNEYIAVITSLPSDVTDSEVLELYRHRWQVELFFKRLKSIMDYGELPKKTTDSIFSWLNGKLMIALLIEKMLENGVFPFDEEFPPEYMERDEDDIYYDSDELHRYNPISR